jgi:hypothetical protein
VTKEQQKHIDNFHEKVIALIYKRRQVLLYNSNAQLEWEAITEEIEKIEDERKTYEEQCRSSQS